MAFCTSNRLQHPAHAPACAAWCNQAPGSNHDATQQNPRRDRGDKTIRRSSGLHSCGIKHCHDGNPAFTGCGHFLSRLFPQLRILNMRTFIIHILPPAIMALVMLCLIFYGMTLELCRDLPRYTASQQKEMRLSPKTCHELAPWRF